MVKWIIAIGVTILYMAYIFIPRKTRKDYMLDFSGLFENIFMFVLYLIFWIIWLIIF